jgi:hypothetical protein
MGMAACSSTLVELSSRMTIGLTNALNKVNAVLGDPCHNALSMLNTATVTMSRLRDLVHMMVRLFLSIVDGLFQ